MSGSWIDDQVWAASGQPCNTESAIYKYWRELRTEGVYLGLPVTPEIETPVGTQQGFSAGRVIVWNAADGASLADDA
jgi:uncharacterized protein with LGFP repeats